jgi:phage gp36-like protein
MPTPLVTLTEAAQLGLPDAAGKNVDTTVQQALLDAAIAEACASGLSARYGSNITAVDASVKQRIVDIWCWRLLKRRGFNSENKSDASARSAYTEAIEWFGNVGGRLLHPVVTSDESGNVLPDVTGGQADRGWRDGMMGRDAIAGDDESEV